MLQNIPDELKAYKSFVLWRLEDRGGEKPTKVPYQINGYKANVINPEHWASFDDALAMIEHYDGIGFVLSDLDPFTFIDLDDTKGDAEQLEIQNRIYQLFGSYSERSPSKKGLHIIVKGSIPKGKRRGTVEVYSRERYMTMTGDVYFNSPILEKQELLTSLYEELGGNEKAEIFPHENQAQSIEDVQLIEIASNASNGEKFQELLTGDWRKYYSTQSEADFALVDIIAHYTDNHEQVIRIFRNSNLGQRPKANRDDYVNYMLTKCFDTKLPPVNIEAVRANLDALKKSIESRNNRPVENIETPKAVNETKDFEFPPGLMGEIARYIYDSSPRPSIEISTAAAIGLLAGICGRSYNIMGTGLNHYIMMVGRTAVGKEAMANGINRLVNEVRKKLPGISQYLGPGEIASGQALLKYFHHGSSCFVSVLGEFGLTMKRLSHPRASSSDILLRRALLDLYNKSGASQILRPTIHADKTKDTEEVRAPSFTMLCEGNPDTFFEALDEHTVYDGLLPRFILITHPGKRTPRRKDHHLSKIPTRLIEDLTALVNNALVLDSNDTTMDVKFNPDAEKFIDGIGDEEDQIMNSDTLNAVSRELWGRLQIKVLKLSALISVGLNPYNPSITLEAAKYAYSIVKADTTALSERFETGKFGSANDENEQKEQIQKAFTDYLLQPWPKLMKYGGNMTLHQARIVPLTYISRKVACTSSFKNDRLGATLAIQKCLKFLIDCGDIIEVPRAELVTKYFFRGKAYMINSIG